jgi:hypothetical protein
MATSPKAMTSSRLCVAAVALLATLGLAAGAAGPASAKPPPSPRPVAFALSPASGSGALLLHGTPGQILRSAVIVRNVTGHQVTVILHAADIRDASNGNADYLTTPLSQAGRWIALAATTVRLAPHASQRVAFTVSIPPPTTGASHYAGIVAINAADLAAAAVRKTAKGRTFTFYRIDRQALPLTIRLPGPLTRSLSLRSTQLTVQPVGAGLVLGLLPDGSELIQSTRISLRVLRGARTIFTSTSTLGQLFPGAALNYRIPWIGKPTPGSYHVQGVIRPQAAAAVNISQTLKFTASKATQLKHETPPTAQQPSPGMPAWMAAALAVAVALLAAMGFTIWKLTRRRPQLVS